jgi:uncharacterized protein YndB with AHSA1/START domain
MWRTVPERIEVRRVVRAPRERLFHAWTDAGELMRWWGPMGLEPAGASVDLRVGGGYRISMRPPGGAPSHAFGEFHEVEPPSRLVFTWAWEGGEFDGLSDTLVTVEFHARGATETEIVLTHERLGPDAVEAHRQGWVDSLERVDAYTTRGEANV